MDYKIKEFLAISYGSSEGSGYGYGSGSGNGYGSGSGVGYGSGYGSGYCDGSGYGFGSGEGTNYGYGDGSGVGYSNVYGEGEADSCGDIKSLNGHPVYVIDGIMTIITSACANIARGYMLHDDFTMQPCYIAKANNWFVFCETLQEARQALQEPN